MSINIATMGFCNGAVGVGGGGAPPYRPDNEEVVRPLVLVTKFEAKDVNTLDALINKIKITLIDD